MGHLGGGGVIGHIECASLFPQWCLFDSIFVVMESVPTCSPASPHAKEPPGARPPPIYTALFLTQFFSHRIGVSWFWWM